jgi:hypothetical protein
MTGGAMASIQRKPSLKADWYVLFIRRERVTTGRITMVYIANQSIMSRKVVTGSERPGLGWGRDLPVFSETADCLISRLKKGEKIRTAPADEVGQLLPPEPGQTDLGAEIVLETIGGHVYAKTVPDGIKEDNLGDLPLF